MMYEGHQHGAGHAGPREMGSRHGHGRHGGRGHGNVEAHGEHAPAFPWAAEAWGGRMEASAEAGGRGQHGPSEGHHGRHGGDPFGRGWHEFGGGRGRGHGRPERPLEQGDLRWLVLDLIAEQPRHGYEIIKAIEDLTDGQYAPSPGVVYPTLTYLEETGLIVGETQGNKKLYTITDEGRAALEANADALQAVRSRIEGARARSCGPLAPEVMRALGNLRAALQVRVSKGELTPESLARITATLDRAAAEIEQS